VAPWFESVVDALLKRVELLEHDTMDVAVRLGGLVPFIRQLREMPLTVVGNSAHRKLTWLRYDSFIEVSYPNCLQEVPRVLEEAKRIGGGRVYSVSAGMPAAIITKGIHQMFPDVFALDLGSVWDAFIGIGGQRPWRNLLYNDREKYDEWLSFYKEFME
jgi:hypothetical protein